MTKFEHRAPSAQTAVDVFKGRWASKLSNLIGGVEAGDIDMFTCDPRPKQAAAAFGGPDGMRVLELGPLEGAHTYNLERLGAAEVVAVEANVEAFLKCLIVKELAGLRRSRFLLGDVVSYLESCDTFDLVFASGILYHMADPVRLIELIARVAPRCFIWTHYFDPSNYQGPERRAEVVHGVTYHIAEYGDPEYEKFWGGNKRTAAWLSRADLLAALERAGFHSVSVIDEQTNHPHGACITLAASK